MNPKKLLTCLLACVLGSTSLTARVSEIVYDYIIVGNGSAGAILARKLSDNHKKKVLVLEAGVNLNDDPEVLNSPILVDDLLNYVTLNDLFSNNKYSFNYVVPVYNTVTFPAGVLQTISASTGRGWGGGSAHNALLCVRGTESIYNQWATLSGNPLWLYNSLLPMMRALENYTPDATIANLLERGLNGPINITQTNPLFTPSPLFVDAFAALFAANTGAGCGFITDYNDPDAISTDATGAPTGLLNLGMSAAQIFADPVSPGVVGQRSFSANTFLPGAVNPDGLPKKNRRLRIESNATVSRVIFNKKTAVGVEFFYGNNTNEVLQAFGKEIILCAGAIANPGILQRSGIGDATLLESLGIDVIFDNPNVGANLQNQYGISATVANTTGSFTAQGVLLGFWSGFTGGALTTPYANDSVRRLQLIGLPTGPVGSPVALLGVISEPKSRGTVKIVTSDPTVDPNIDLNMYSDGPGGTNGVSIPGTDANLAVSAYKIISNAVGAGNVIFPSANFYAAGPPTFSVDGNLLFAAQSPQGLSIQDHFAGTAKMSTSPATGVVDGSLRVFGVKNLLVADLSVAPLTPDGNTCFGAYVIGLGAAALLGASTPPAL